MCEIYFGQMPLIVDVGVKTGVKIRYDNPYEVGADRVADAAAVYQLYGGPACVVDFGTATTFDCITGDGRFIGGAIMPGLRTAADQLTRLAAKLPATELAAPARVIGRRTEECIQAGVLFGAADAADGMLRRIFAEWPTPNHPVVIATGGLAGVIAPFSELITRIEPDLTLRGLRIAAGHLGLRW
jgi:type III pantothenate kinase